MSKAFTRESDEMPAPVARRLNASVPPGVKNYLTSNGARRLREELEKLVQIERPALMASKESGRASEALNAIDQRIYQLNQSLQSAVIVEPPPENDGCVRFGATVTVRESDGIEATYRIVGVDEADVDRGWISWLSPLAKALLNSKTGDRVRLKFPAVNELEILRVACG